MPPEGPNKAEELLQRYAKERRERGNFSLHPATRRLLQGEVTRQFGKARTTSSWLAFFDFRPRGFALAGAIAAVVVVGVSLVVTTRQSSKRPELARGISPRAEQELLLARVEQLAEAKKEAATQPLDMLAKADTGLDRYVEDSKALKTVAVDRPALATKPQPQDLMLFADVSSNVLATNTFDYALSLAPGQNAQSPQVPAAPTANLKASTEVQDGTRSLASSTRSPVADNERGKLQQFGVAFANSSPVATGIAAADESYFAKQAAGPAQNQSALPSTTLAPLLNAPRAAPALVQESRRNAQQASDALGVASQEKLARADAAGVAGAASIPTDPNQFRYYRLGFTPEEQVAQRPALGGKLAETAVSDDRSGKVLTEFTVERQGNTMRLRDADGSVYEGTVVPLADIQLQPESEARFERDKDAAVRERLAVAKEKSGTAPAEVSFSVSGSNVTSRQMVTVRGRFTSATNAPSASGAVAAWRIQEPVPSFGRQSGASTTTQAAPAMIDGLLRVGASGEQPFRAVPAPK